jgi:hypothetical protein
LELTASSSALFLPSKIEKNVISLSCCKGNTKIVFLRRAAPIIEALLGKEKRTFWEDEKRDDPVYFFVIFFIRQNGRGCKAEG